MAAISDFIGKRFGRLLVIDIGHKDNCGSIYLICLCDCMTIKEVRKDHLTNGATTSCRCYWREQVYKGNKSKLMSEGTKQKLSIYMKACVGDKGHNWRGGISFEPYCPLFNREFKERVRAWFVFRCLKCGKSQEENGEKLSVHHVEYNKKACCDWKPAHFAALCSSCHSKTNGDRERWEAMFHTIIDEIYDGRSYYTQDEYKEVKR